MQTEPITRLKTFLLKPSAGGRTRQLVILTSCSVTSCGTIFLPPPPRQSQTKKPLGQQQYCFGATIKSYLTKSNAIDRLSDGMKPPVVCLMGSRIDCVPLRFSTDIPTGSLRRKANISSWRERGLNALSPSAILSIRRPPIAIT